jgi:hypothetical protein
LLLLKRASIATKNNKPKFCAILRYNSARIKVETMTNAEKQTIHLVAGIRPDGELVYEQVHAEAIGDECYRLLTSPLFAKGCAKGDVIRMMAAGSFEVEQHGGNLCIRVLARDNVGIIKQRLAAELKNLPHELDFENERSLVYSIGVNQGFENIEKAFNTALQDQNDNALWLYANVYDPQDGQTPLNWWHDFLAK